MVDDHHSLRPHGVGIGIYASVLHALGLLDGLAALAEPANDVVGMELASASLPKRVGSDRARSSRVKAGQAVKPRQADKPGQARDSGATDE